MDKSLFDAARRRPALLLAAATALFVTLMAVQAQADTHAPNTVALCANPAGQLTVAPANGCPSNTTELIVATGDGLDAATEADNELTARLDALEGLVNALVVSNTALTTTVDDLVASNTQLTNQLGAAEERIDVLEDTFDGVSRDGATLLFTGMNLQVVNGTGSTDGDPNGLGNVIIGYNTERDDFESEKTGSHYLVVGNDHNYTSFGGIIAGLGNTASGDWASVTGGYLNTASGDWASVTGGVLNTASGVWASVSGGTENTSSGRAASVSGGEENTSSGPAASVSGGQFNLASGSFSSILGGRDNTASGFASSVSGGSDNTAGGSYSSILGGRGNTATGLRASVSGGRWNIASGIYSSILGGGGEDASDGIFVGNGYGISPN